MVNAYFRVTMDASKSRSEMSPGSGGPDTGNTYDALGTG